MLDLERDFSSSLLLLPFPLQISAFYLRLWVRSIVHCFHSSSEWMKNGAEPLIYVNPMIILLQIVQVLDILDRCLLQNRSNDGGGYGYVHEEQIVLPPVRPTLSSAPVWHIYPVYSECKLGERTYLE